MEQNKSTCTYCGCEKPDEAFRAYYQNKYSVVNGHNLDGAKHYPYCKECEKIENRRKYLLQREQTETGEYEMICKLYDKRIDLGLDVPRSYSSASPSDEIMSMDT